MVKPSYQDEQVVVFDDVLPAEDFASLFRFLATLDYATVHRAGWRKVWRLYDGDPLRGPTTWYRPDQGGAATVNSDRETPIDLVIEWIVERQLDIGPVVGAARTDWAKLSLTPWIYPVGSGLSLHQDGSAYTGAFTFFVHQEWRLHWGGHLLVLDSRTRSRRTSPGENAPAFLDDRQESARAFVPGFALTVLPKPNRIAFLSPQALHLLTRVDPNAGQAARMSIAGFFHREV
jgi:hypothetical protein